MDWIQTIMTGFASGLGTGLANWLLIKRLEALELKAKVKLNGGKQ